jgi:sugar lactone lactonase YvrE
MTTPRPFRRQIVRVAVALVALAVAYLLFWPVAVDTAAWTPPPPPALEGPYALNTKLTETERLADGAGLAPEDVAVDAEGRVYGGVDDGRILRVTPGGAPETFANTGGRPAGLRFDAAGNLLVCDCNRGLLSIDPAGTVRLLSDEAGGVRIRFADDLDIAADGTVYFSDASTHFGFRDFVLDVIEHRPNGRLLAYDPKTGATRVVLDGLYFANGIAVSDDQTYVLVCESNTYSVRRVWLAGPKAGQSETWIDGLPGFPDGILSNGHGLYWLAISAPRDRLLDTLLPHPFLRKILARLPRFALPAPKRQGLVLGLDAGAHIVQNLQDPTGSRFANVTNVVERDGWLYLGSLSERAMGRVRVP